MNCRSKNSDASCVMHDAYCTIRHTRYAIRNTKEKAFSLIEAVTALIILAIVSSSVLVVINRCMVSVADSTLRYQAFEVARENMEKLLASESVKEMAEFGNSDKYPEIQWQTVVETFYEPITKRMWLQGVCSAEYTDTAGQLQTVELTHWLTDLSKEDILKITEERKEESESEDEEPEPEDEEPEPDDEKPKPEDDELSWCGKTLDEILKMDLDELWNWDCPEFWDWLANR